MNVLQVFSREDAQRVLVNVSFETHDLKEAKALLNELS